MRGLLFGIILSGLSMIMTGPAHAADPALDGCDVCTCQSGEVLCLPAEIEEAFEEQVVCGNACATVGSTHGSRTRVDMACSEVLECQHRSAPAANGMWLAAGALGLLALGMFTLRRVRARSVAEV